MITAQEARKAITKSPKQIWGEIENSIEHAVHNGNEYTFREKLSKNHTKKLKELGYTIDNAGPDIYQIKW